MTGGIKGCSCFLLHSEITEIVLIEAIDLDSGSMNVLEKFFLLL